MTWPLPLVGGLPVGGINQDGYPDYYGSNNAEICPPGRRYECVGGCKCLWPDKVDMPLWHGGEHHGETPASASQSIRRSEILQRAIVWIAHGFGGHSADPPTRNNTEGIEACSEADSTKTCPQYFHGGACCSLPSMAWNISTHNCNRGPESTSVDCRTEARPGDAVSIENGNHIALFRNWVDDTKKAMMVYQRKGKVNIASYGYHPKSMYCLRRRNVIEDVP